MKAQRALCIHDMSSVGRCSLTVISPVLSVMGIQCVPLATTVLSTHFGGFGEVTSCDLTKFCDESLNQFSRLEVQFDCVYSGYLASPMQMQIVKKAFRQNAQALKVCDPVMADNGKLYSAVTTHMVEVFMELCKDSDIITPNPTEACILLGKDYSKVVFSQQELQNMVMELHQKYKHSVVITGAKLENQSVICAGFDEKSDRYFTVECNYIPVHFPGTGDLFCAVLTGGVLKGDGLPQACIRATEFVEKCVRATYETGVDTRFGVELEPQLKYLLE